MKITFFILFGLFVSLCLLAFIYFVLRMTNIYKAEKATIQKEDEKRESEYEELIESRKERIDLINRFGKFIEWCYEHDGLNNQEFNLAHNCVVGDYTIGRNDNISEVLKKGKTKLVEYEHNGCLYLGDDENPYFVFKKILESDITTITIENDTLRIGDAAFLRCKGIVNVIINNGLVSIGDIAFLGCIGLTSVTIPDSVISIGSYAFGDCRAMATINYSGTKDGWRAIIKGDKWNDYTGNYTVICTDGKLDKKENEIV